MKKCLGWVSIRLSGWSLWHLSPVILPGWKDCRTQFRKYFPSIQICTPKFIIGVLLANWENYNWGTASKLGKFVSFALWGVSKVLKFVFSECHKYWKIFSWGINQWRLSRKTKKTGFKIWVLWGPVFSFLAKFLHFSSKTLGIVLDLFFSSVNSTNFSIVFVKFRQIFDIKLS